MVNLWNWVAAHWQSWGINGIVAAIASALTWMLARRKEWEESRRARREEKIDAKVLGKIRALCEGTSAIYGTSDIAERIKMNIDETADALERLEIIGRVTRYDIGTTDDPGPGWRSTFR